VTHPESGTISFVYNLAGTLLRKTGAKGQKTEFTYDSDGRVTEARKYLTGGPEDTCQKVPYYYETNPFDATFSQNAVGRLAAVSTGCQGTGGGQFIEMYSYDETATDLARRRHRG